MDKINRQNCSKQNNPIKTALKLAGVALLCLLFFLAGYLGALIFS
ncbi:MAG: hypothetical protein UHN02_06340 [Acutalibacteraceae bacterium]|nr:hypothetical protein [Acutalibacteraceae bacterium]